LNDEHTRQANQSKKPSCKTQNLTTFVGPYHSQNKNQLVSKQKQNHKIHTNILKGCNNNSYLEKY